MRAGPGLEHVTLEQTYSPPSVLIEKVTKAFRVLYSSCKSIAQELCV